ncbi:hypothetical protein PMI16_00457 [Herbaspirillum sp. CF444]|uniref:DUF1853 family protein n=1 Tax=Herbaspirillum sp. CF444 TaxID=1144319 RepID=UPI0002726DFF|nr:DUF1853 family protein [Herbaspirillum sp. CF444]EJL93786.1 hypothetical protein PMI16_00457 [Herbaspirillum sp. CF444]
MPTLQTEPSPELNSRTDAAGPSYQSQFHQRWEGLRDPHVRALAWLLEAPDLLDAHAARWIGRIATLGPLSDMDVTWLHTLDRNPRALYALINAQPSARLGRYAEKLLTFYLRETGRLIAHNVQVRNGPNDTIGEFDFLVHDERHTGAVHWEFATKFYLLESHQAQMQADAFVGPNLADSLGAKMDKIMQQQLKLAEHPAAAQYLSQPVTQAQALVKGWLFYRDAVAAMSLPPGLGIAAGHCHGFWCELSALDLSLARHYLVLPRLEWLAPARAPVASALSADQLHESVSHSFAETLAPVMIAVCDRHGDVVLERQRGFIVPDDWREKAAQRVQHAVVKY